MSHQQADLPMTPSTPAAPQSNASAPNNPAMKVVFDTTELLESILLQLDEIDDVVHCKAVNRQFRSAILSSPSFRFIPAVPLLDSESLKPYLADRKTRQKHPNPNKAADANVCINPLLSNGVQFQRFRPDLPLKRQVWHMSTFEPVCPAEVRFGAVFKHDEEFSPLTRLDTDSVAAQELLATRIAHPRLRICIDVTIGQYGKFPSICGENQEARAAT